jgi:hypothetical protein
VLSGKTGTAQTANPLQPTNAWFISFAPYDNPEIAVCVFVENGNSGGGAASPIAKNIIDSVITMERGREVLVAALPEAVGRNDRVMSVSFDDSDLTNFAAADANTESAVDVADFVPETLRDRQIFSLGGLLAQPNFKAITDRQGQVGGSNSAPKPRTFRWIKRKR